jgi:hypothetical protein
MAVYTRREVYVGRGCYVGRAAAPRRRVVRARGGVCMKTVGHLLEEGVLVDRSFFSNLYRET